MQYFGALGVNVVTQVSGVHTGVCGQFLLVQSLDEFEGQVGGKAVLAVALHLQGGEVKEAGRLFGSLLLLYVSYEERLALDELKGLLSFLLTGEAALGSREGGITIDRCQHPVRLWLEVVNLFLPIDNQSQRGGLYTADGKHLPVLSVLQRIEARGIHAQYPVADGTRETCQIEELVFLLVFQVLETFTDGLIRHRRYPQTLHRALRSCLLHHPTLDEFTLLPGITTVDDFISILHQFLNNSKLFLDMVGLDELDAKARRNHRQR